MPNTDNPRSFSFADPVLYNGAYYPSVEDTIEQNGTVRKGRVFADANGQYFTLDSQGNAVPAMVQRVLPEVTVTPSQQEMLANAFSRHLTMSNDKTQVANAPHRPYNTHLSDNALRGAKYHAQWEREHPNLSSWSYAASALPFAVAAAPLAMGTGQAVAGTALGQTALNSVNAFMSTPLMEMVNAATGLGFAVKGGYDISQGKFTPETALEFIGLYPGIKATKRLLNKTKPSNNSFVSELDWSPEGWFSTRSNKTYDADDVKALKSHISEYLKIEQEAKANGSWLKMPDGSTWTGDPRSWVQMQSKDYDKYTGNSPLKYEAFAHSSPNKFDTFSYSHFGKTDDGFFGKGFYTHPAENINGKLIGRNSYGDEKYLLTTNAQNPFDLSNSNFEYAEWFNREGTNVPKGIFDNYDSVYYGLPGHKSVGTSPSELIVPKSNNYKSLLGNNGNFDALNPNIYKGLIPLGIMSIPIDSSLKSK